MQANCTAALSSGLSVGAARLGLNLDATQSGKMFQLLEELAQWNRTYNLTRIDSLETMVTHHLLDSLAASPDLVGTRILDVGTGAGFPGLPLAILHPQRSFTLIDGTAKKIRFVAHAARLLGLNNVQALHVRAELLRSARPFDTVVARAVGSLKELVTLVQRLTHGGSHLLAYKGQRPDAELAALPSTWQLRGVRSLEIPGLAAARCLVTLIAAPPGT